MRVLGLDPGSRRTGYGVVERSGNQFCCVDHGTITPRARLSLSDRLHDIASRVGAVIERTAPACVVVEEAFYHENVRSTLVLGHVRGALLVAAVQHGIPVAEYSPREIKMSVVGNGGASKEQVAFMVRRMVGISSALQPDAADALAAAICHLHRTRPTPPKQAASAAAERLAAMLARKGRR